MLPEFHHIGSSISHSQTLFAAISQMASKDSVVDYLPGTDTEGRFVTDKDLLADRARQADIIIAGMGERAYAEAAANIPDLVLATGQHDLVTLLAASTTAPIVTVLFEGRPRLLGMNAVVIFSNIFFSLPWHNTDQLTSLFN